MTVNKIYSNFLWRLFERCGAQGVTFIVSLVLARLLDPDVYGTVALVTVFTTIMQAFVDSGMGNALIQKKNADDLDFSTVFYFNLAISLALYAIMFFVAPLIGRFYDKPELVTMIRVLSIIILIAGVKNIQQAYVSRNLLYKKFFFATLSGTIAAAIAGIFMAYLGFGAWALVTQMLLNALVDTVFLWFTVKWRPHKMFSFKRLKSLFSFGWKLLISALLDIIYNELAQLVIGKKYSSSDLGYYNRGKQFPSVFVSNVNVAIDSVLLPVMSKDQDSIDRIKIMTRRSVRVGIYVMSPIMIGLAVCGKPLIRLILTEKWLPAVPYLWIFCIIYLLYPVQTANLNAIKAIGRSDVYLYLEVIKKVIGVVILIISMNYGVFAVACGVMITRILYQVINAIPSKRIFNYNYLEVVKDLFPSILVSAVMGVCVYSITLLNFPDLVTLIIQIPLGAVVYILISYFFKLDSFIYIKNNLKGFNFKKNNKH